jgi:F-type H+-transporting ATPase subunit gamma
MQTLQGLKKRIESSEELQSVVKTMKSLAAVNIRQYERAVESLADYNNTVEMGLQIVLRGTRQAKIAAKSAPRDRLGAIVFGSDQGMCGSLNEQIVSHALRSMEEFGAPDRVLLAVGERTAVLLEDNGLLVEEYFSVPNSTSGITPMVQQLLLNIENWNSEQGVHHVFLFYSKQLSGASYRPHEVHLLPVDELWLSGLQQKSWPSKALPTFSMEWDSLFSALVREYLFVSLFRAFAESLASENASRLAAMEGAEKNIQEQLTELTTQYHQQRQMSITEELLDIVAGFEALKKN